MSLLSISTGLAATRDGNGSSCVLLLTDVINHTDNQLIEGLASSFAGLFAWLILPDYPSTTKWLTPEERILAAQRLAYDGIGHTQGATANVGEWEACKMVFKDWRSWLFVVMYMLCTGAQTIQ